MYGGVSIWNIKTKEHIRDILEEHTPVLLSPDGKYLFTGSVVRDPLTGEKVGLLGDEEKDFLSISISHDGRTLLTSDKFHFTDEGLTKVWRIPEDLKPSAVDGFVIYEE